MRLFLGLEIPTQIKAEIHDFLLPIQKSPKGWENPHDYHQTVLFIGETKEEEHKVIEERLRQFTFRPFELQFTHFEFFNRRIMYLAMMPSLELLELKTKVDIAFMEWRRPETKSFIPHVTVKRWQRYEYDHLKSGLNRKHDFPSFKVNRLALFLSKKDAENRKYHVISAKDFEPSNQFYRYEKFL